MRNATGETQAMRQTTSTINGAGPLPGSVVSQYIRCGKSGCHCNEGDKHGPYFYRVWRVGDQVRKEYIPTADAERVRNRCALYLDCVRRLRQMKAEHAALRREIKKHGQALERLRRGQEKPGR